MLSYWEKDVLKFDFAIVGGGILGLWTGIELRKKYPKASIAILEREIIPHGASTRNAGFSCFGSVTELLSNFESIGEEMALSVVEKRWRGMQKINQVFSNSHIDYQNLGGYELISDQADLSDKIQFINQKLFPIFNQNVFSFHNEKIAKFGFHHINSIIYNPIEGQLHSGKLVNKLIEKCGGEGIRYFTNTNVKIENDRLTISSSHSPEISASHIIITTNAFVPKFIQDVKPGRGQVLITKPIENLKFQGTFHFDNGYYYFRNVDDRVLFGGGRNIDFDTETTSEFELNEKIQSDLVEKLQSIILPNHNFEIDMQWSGIMAFSDNHLPKVERISEKTIYAMNCNGMGVSLSPITAEEICQLF